MNLGHRTLMSAAILATLGLAVTLVGPALGEDPWDDADRTSRSRRTTLVSSG